MSKAVRAITAGVVSVLTLALFAPLAHAVQASGSIQLVPSKQTGIVKDESITVDVFFTNSSTQTPPLAVAATLATVTGPITVDLGCKDCECTQQNTTDLVFVPGPQMGCTVKGAGVTGCAAGGPGEVLINLDPLGLNIPDATPVFLATITLKSNVDNLELLGLRAATGICALKACITPPNTQCAFCAAEGCTFLVGTIVTQELLRCKHSCLNQVNFTNNFDAYIFQGVAVVNDPTFDPSTESFRLMLGEPGNPPVIDFTVPAGDIVMTANGVWKLIGNANQNNAGIDLIQITRQTGVGCQNSYRITVRFYDDLSALQALVPPIILRTEITFDGRAPFVNQEEWTQLLNGNLRNDIDNASTC